MVFLSSVFKEYLAVSQEELEDNLATLFRLLTLHDPERQKITDGWSCDWIFVTPVTQAKMPQNTPYFFRLFFWHFGFIAPAVESDRNKRDRSMTSDKGPQLELNQEKNIFLLIQSFVSSSSLMRQRLWWSCFLSLSCYLKSDIKFLLRFPDV